MDQHPERQIAKGRFSKPVATAGFVGKLYLIQATVDGDYTWLGIMIVIGSMISLAYYLRVVAAMWMRPGPMAVVATGETTPVMAGGSPEADAAGRSQVEVVAVAVVCAAATIGFGIIPEPLFDAARAAGRSIGAF